MSRVYLLPESSDWITLAGAYRRYEKHKNDKPTMYPLHYEKNKHPKEPLKDLTYVCVTCHGSRGAATIVVDAAAEFIAALIPKNSNSVKLRLDICFGGSSYKDRDAVLKSLVAGIHKHDRRLSGYRAALGPVVSGWEQKRGYIKADGESVKWANLLEAVAVEKSGNDIRRAKQHAEKWRKNFGTQDSQSTLECAKIIHDEVKWFYVDLHALFSNQGGFGQDSKWGKGLLKYVNKVRKYDEAKEWPVSLKSVMNKGDDEIKEAIQAWQGGLMDDRNSRKISTDFEANWGVAECDRTLRKYTPAK